MVLIIKNTFYNSLYTISFLALLSTVSSIHLNTKISPNTRLATLLSQTMSNIDPLLKANKVYFADGKCDAPTCKNGKCVNANQCQCNDGFAQLPGVNTMCEYKLKNQLTAFLLELFLVIGIGHFYAGRILHGILKLLVIALVVVVDFLLKSPFKANNYKTQKIFMIITYVLYFIIIFMQVFDVIMFGLNKYSDGNSMPLFVYGD